MLKKLSRITNFILIGIVVGLFVGVSVRKVLGDETFSGTVRSDNLTVNMSGTFGTGLMVANGNALVPNGKVGIGTMDPSEALTVTGKVLSSDGFCIGTSCIAQWNDLKTMLGIGTTTPPVIPTSYTLAVIKEGTGTGTVVSAPTGINCGSACAYTFSSGVSVTLTANKTTGSVFTGWSDACTGATTSCTVVMSSAKNVRAIFTSGTETPPAQPTCTGTPPPTGTGVVPTPYTTVAISPSTYTGPPNTVWGYVDDVPVGGPSCTWGCAFPTTVNNGKTGCSPAAAGSGVTVTVNDISTGQKVSGVTITAGTIFGQGSFEAVGLGGGSSSFITGTNGTTPEFLFQPGPPYSWTSLAAQMPGYKIRSATGCTPQVFVNGNKQYNQCINAVNGTPVTINMVPGDISTLPTTRFETLTYHRGETLKGSITGGDPNNTWACMDNPSTATDHLCNSGRTDAWRKLTVPYDGHADGWQLVETDKGDSIQLGGLLIEQGFPLGTYTQYVKTGQWGVPSQTTSKSITVVSGGDSTALAPKLDLFVAKSNIDSNSSTLITWIPMYATWCWAEPWNTPNGTGWKDFSSFLHTESTGNLTTTQTYTMKCGNGNAAQDVTKSVTVSVTPVDTSTNSFTATPNPVVSGTSATLSWSMHPSSNCFTPWLMNGGIFTGADTSGVDKYVGDTGTISTGNLTTNTTYTVYCKDFVARRAVEKSVTVRVQ